MVQNRNKGSGTNSKAMSRALRFVVLEVSIRLRLILICTRWQSKNFDGARAAVAVQKRVDMRCRNK